MDEFKQLDHSVPGDWVIRWVDVAPGDRIYGMDFICPCGCGDKDYLPLTLAPKQEDHWLWDGNLEAPTIAPSLARRTPCKWHGFLEQGRWNWCAGTPVAANCLSPGKQR